MTQVSGELSAAYQCTRYSVRIHERELRLTLGSPSTGLIEAMRSFCATSGAFITAYNPHSQVTEVSANAANQERLHADLQMCSTAIFDGDGQGVDKQWPAEPSFHALGISHDHARTLGRKYGQNAILFIEEDGTPRLELLR